MMIHIAENGHSFELDCQPSTIVEAVQNFLVSLTGVSQNDQLLIVGDTRLEPQRSLGSYQLPAEGRPVFLFNRQRLACDSAPPPPEDPEHFSELSLPPPPSASRSDHPLDEAPDPALRALPSYERQFKYHFQKGHAIFSSSQRKFDACRRLLREQQVQQMALATARENMDHYYTIIDQLYKEFMKRFTLRQRQHSDLLANFERDLERLRVCKLHPALRTEARKTLLDCVKEGSLRKWADDCAISHKQFSHKVLQLKTSFAELQRRVEELFVSAPTVDVQKLDQTIEDHVRFTEEQASIIQSLSKDVNTVKKLIDDCIKSQFSASLRPHDAVSALGPMYDVHDKNHLPRIEACDFELKKLLEHCKKNKNEMSLCVHKRMQNVAALQSSIRNIRNQLSAFNEAMARQDDNFEELKLVRKVGSSYKACLAEVVRRKACMKLYMGQAGQLAEKLARKREAEIARREDFLRVQSVYIPRDVLEAMGLFEIPSQCVVNIAPFDIHLLDIDVADLERYAPESLVGPLLKAAESESGVVSTSLVSGGFGGSYVDIKEGSDPETAQDGSIDDIVGTSKLEVENAWLKADLASAIAMLCSLEPNVEVEVGGDNQSVAQKTAEALNLKDEYAKHLQKMLALRQSQCNAYEKRIQELEQRLREQHVQLSNLPAASTSSPKEQVLDVLGKEHTEASEISGMTALGQTSPDIGVEDLMDDMVSSIPVLHSQHISLTSSIHDTETASDQGGRIQEGCDESMSEFNSGASALDASMAEARKKECSPEDVLQEDISKTYTGHSGPEKLDHREGVNENEINAGHSLSTKYVCKDKVEITEEEVGNLFQEREQIVALESALEQKTRDCIAAEDRVQATLAEVVRLGRDLENNSELLRECQMNCAHLENRLHEAREEAKTHLCAADRRAAEYNALRASSVKLRGLMERLKTCITASGFVESLRTLSSSLNSSSISDAGEDVGYEFRAAIRILSERVGALVQQRTELLERCTKAEAVQNHLSKELENKTEMLKNMYAKRQQEKQASKEKICFTHFEVHELAIFMRNAAGYYEALNHNCPHYYLSDESIALFLEHLPNGQQYIVGQIVHIDRNIARGMFQNIPGNSPISSENDISGSNTAAVAGSRSRYNPYSLPFGTEFFVVTVAMIPEFAPISSSIS
ncbi:hypothetical protein O6H91_07G123700 [Diphasiastrum complanatum]|uniref:Uncharacterized protein n=1 Tax=Diphasiastrum complanatum TaxID=34168 RepID=A0ACC2D9T7_DIPCM|nr:hypothetical protein O6H91_07G123700 [Diphasiastrum complanatum]